MEFIPAMKTTYHLYCYYHVGGLSLNKNTDNITGVFWSLFSEACFRREQVQLIQSSCTSGENVEKMWGEKSWTIQNIRTTSCSLSKSPFNAGSGGNALGQNFT